MIFLYRLTLPDGRAYIGVAKKPRRRFSVHCRSRWPIGEAIRQAGRENVKCEVLVGGEADYIFGLAEKAIAVFQTRWPQGLNIAAGGYGGRDPPPEVRQKISVGQLGRRKSTEEIAKIARASRDPKRIAQLVARNKSSEARERAKQNSVVLLRFAQSPENRARLAAMNKTLDHRLKQAAAIRGK